MRKLRLALLYGVLVLLVAANVTAVLKREQIGDWWVMRDYVPAAEISALATQTTMTPDGKHLFYVNRPALEDKAGFNKHCSDHTEHSVVLGCYHGNRQGIYLYNVADERLEGVKQVTAAHEMLHQAFDRLGGEERTRIIGLLEELAASGTLDARIQDKLKLYRASEPNSLPNEMHSIFGTEVSSLPVELEAYYKQYFSNRAAVVAFSNTYQGEFEARKAKVAAYDAQLDELDAQIEANKRELASLSRGLAERRKEVEARLAAGDNEGYQAGADDYNRRVATYNDLIDRTQVLVSEFNKLAGERNAISAEEQALQQALDSRRQETAP